MLTSAATTIPSTSSSIRRVPVPWWSSTVAQAIARRKRAFRCYLRHRDDTHLVRNRERARCKKVIKEAKRASWQSFLTQLNHETPLSKIWSLVRSLSGKRSITSLPVLHINGTDVVDPGEILNTISRKFQSLQLFRKL